MVEQLSMDQILDDKPIEPAVQVETTKTETSETPTPETVERTKSSKKAWQDREQEAQGKVRDPATGQFVTQKTEEKEEPKIEAKVDPAKVEPPKQDLTDKEKAFLKGMQEERNKRQELERRLTAIETAKKPDEPVKSFWDDPEAALAKQQADFRAETDKMRQEAVAQRLNTSEFIARKAHADFDEKVEVFGELLKQTPGLYQEWLAQPDPAEFAYKTAKAHTELKEAGSVDELRTKIEKEVRIKLEAELKAKAEALEKERAALPPSLSDARSKGSNKVVWSGPPSMDSILKG